jgi:hypothetical protein
MSLTRSEAPDPKISELPTLCLDFDGVIHSYTSGWKGAAVIPDPPVSGAIDAIQRYREKFRVCIHSSRFNRENGDPITNMFAVRKWLVQHGIGAWSVSIEGSDEDVEEHPICLVSTKPPALVTIDDRAITFTGTFPDVQTLLDFKPWNKQHV